VDLQGRKGVDPKAGMQMLPSGLLSYENCMIFIIDSRASRTSTFNEKSVYLGLSSCMKSHQY